MKVTKEEQLTAVETLKGWLKPGDKIFYTIRSVSRSGMSRNISFFVVREGDIKTLDWHMLRAGVGSTPSGRGGWENGVRMKGCGMDMAFAAVYELGRILWPEGFGERGIAPFGSEYRPDTKEKAQKFVSKGVKFRGRNGDPSGWDDDGGYALKACGL